ncbi:hypothetical protein NoPa_00158 [Pseudomonas phage vB_PpuM-NoPa]|uniref:Uncharacterized protein n=3 Tax=Tartuvirus TaxID=3424912 RepID=A0AAX4N037_9CAUD
MKPKYTPGGWMHYVARAKQLLDLKDSDTLEDHQYKVLLRNYINGKDVEIALEELK